MGNLKDETLKVLREHGKSPLDILWIGGDDFTIPEALFWRLADRGYDDGYGAPEVAQDLVIVGDDWWLERSEYDGAEEWDYKTLPTRPKEQRVVKRVIARDIGWETLREMQEDKP